MEAVSSALTSLYHSGVGWTADILTISIFFDADLECDAGIPSLVRDAASGESRVEYHRALFVGGALVRGFARVSAPAGRTIVHEGITARLSSGLFVLGDVNTRDLLVEEVSLEPPGGSLTGVVDLPFTFRSTGARPLAESFEGTLFSIRHQVAVTVARPWYTFPVSASAAFRVQRVHDIHRPFREVEAEEAAPEGAPAADASGLYRPQTLELSPFEGEGGSCVFSFDKGWCVGGAEGGGGWAG